MLENVYSTDRYMQIGVDENLQWAEARRRSALALKSNGRHYNASRQLIRAYHRFRSAAGAILVTPGVRTFR